jgi:flagellar hook-associated protein 3 FlgL
MRMTFNTLFRNTLRDVQRTAADYARAQQVTSSGIKLQRPSDNPSDAATALGARAEVRALDRYRTAADSVESRLMVVDTVLSDVIRSITTAQTRAAAGRSTILTPEQREALALEVEGVRESVFTAVTTSYRGMYVFSGSNTTTPPYTKAGATVSPYQGDAAIVSVDVSRTTSVAVTLDGAAMLQGGAAQDLFATLDQLAADIRNGDMTGIDARTAELDAGFSRVTQAQSRVGATLSALPTENERLGQLRRASDTRRAGAEEANLADAISELTRAKQAYEAAIAATGTTQRLTLLDYLR